MSDERTGELPSSRHDSLGSDCDPPHRHRRFSPRNRKFPSSDTSNRSGSRAVTSRRRWEITPRNPVDSTEFLQGRSLVTSRTCQGGDAPSILREIVRGCPGFPAVMYVLLRPLTRGGSLRSLGRSPRNIFYAFLEKRVRRRRASRRQRRADRSTVNQSTVH